MTSSKVSLPEFKRFVCLSLDQCPFVRVGDLTKTIYRCVCVGGVISSVYTVWQAYFEAINFRVFTKHVPRTFIPTSKSYRMHTYA